MSFYIESLRMRLMADMMQPLRVGGRGIVLETRRELKCTIFLFKIQMSKMKFYRYCFLQMFLLLWLAP